MSLAVLAAVILYASWSDILPAFRIFDEMVLWQHKVELEGEVSYMPVTLKDLVFALITFVVLFLLVKRLPAFIEIVLRQRSTITPGTC